MSSESKEMMPILPTVLQTKMSRKDPFSCIEGVTFNPEGKIRPSLATLQSDIDSFRHKT